MPQSVATTTETAELVTTGSSVADSVTPGATALVVSVTTAPDSLSAHVADRAVGRLPPPGTRWTSSICMPRISTRG